MKKLIKINTRIDAEKTTFLKKSKLLYELCKSCIIGK